MPISRRLSTNEVFIPDSAEEPLKAHPFHWFRQNPVSQKRDLALPATPYWGLGAIQLLMAYIAIPSLVFSVLGQFFYMMHPLVNADYILLGLLSPWLPYPLLFCGYFLTFLTEILVNIAPVYNFSFGEFILSLRYAKLVNHVMVGESGLEILVGALLISHLALKIGAFFPRVTPRKRLSGPLGVLLFAGVSICLLDILNGTSFIPFRDPIAFADVNFAYSGIRRAAMSMRAALNSNQTIVHPITAKEAATGPLFDQIQTLSKENAVVVVVESMGQFINLERSHLWTGNFTNTALNNKYSVHFREIPFQGATVHGEFRELCQVRLDSMGSEVPPHCLPVLFKEKGYRAIAYHGFSNQFYSRFQWYPKLGFDQSWFAQDLKRAGVSRTCGASFTGICDLDVLNKIRMELLQDRTDEQPRFIYWMTLNSHLPIATNDVEASLLHCQSNNLVEYRLCVYSHIINQVLAGIAQLAVDPKLLPTRFTIVGDHAPPFKRLDIRSQFKNDVVPAIELVPKLPSKAADASIALTSSYHK